MPASFVLFAGLVTVVGAAFVGRRVARLLRRRRAPALPPAAVVRE